MEDFFGDVLNWSALSLVNINVSSMEEMLVGTNIVTILLLCEDDTIARVIVFKLLQII